MPPSFGNENMLRRFVAVFPAFVERPTGTDSSFFSDWTRGRVS